MVKALLSLVQKKECCALVRFAHKIDLRLDHTSSSRCEHVAACTECGGGKGGVRLLMMPPNESSLQPPTSKKALLQPSSNGSMASALTVSTLIVLVVG
jgi:hypothetical protein